MEMLAEVLPGAVDCGRPLALDGNPVPEDRDFDIHLVKTREFDGDEIGGIGFTQTDARPVAASLAGNGTAAGIRVRAGVRLAESIAAGVRVTPHSLVVRSHLDTRDREPSCRRIALWPPGNSTHPVTWAKPRAA